MRVTLLKQFAKQHFPATPLLDYALEVEKLTVSKVMSYDKAFCIIPMEYNVKHERSDSLLDKKILATELIRS
jgi:hypothetical protein